MFNLVFSDLMDPQKIDKLKELAKNKITVRGYNIDQVNVAPKLKNNSQFLPINECGFEDEMILIDKIRSRGMITKRHETGGLVTDDWIVVLKKEA